MLEYLLDDRRSQGIGGLSRIIISLVRHGGPQQGSYTQVDEPDLGTKVDVAALPGLAVDLRLLFGV